MILIGDLGLILRTAAEIHSVQSSRMAANMMHSQQCKSLPIAGLHIRQFSGMRASTSAPAAPHAQRLVQRSQSRKGRSCRRSAVLVQALKDGAMLDRKLRVGVIGGGPAGACTADTLAKAGIETYLIERKLDNCKV